jgi:hypothetical protein
MYRRSNITALRCNASSLSRFGAKICDFLQVGNTVYSSMAITSWEPALDNSSSLRSSSDYCPTTTMVMYPYQSFLLCAILQPLHGNVRR